VPRKRLNLSAYRSMWLFAMFDLPVDSPKARRDYTRFRNSLLADGFNMLQLSVYARYCDSEEASLAHRRYLRKTLPLDGEVRLIAITDRQFEKMEVFFGKKRGSPEKPPKQLMLF
jgi:CRISPR-associated protein Cas2